MRVERLEFWIIYDVDLTVGRRVKRMVAILLVAVVLVLYFVFVPILKKRRAGRDSYASELGYLVGEKAYVVSQLGASKTGMVRVGTDVWSARAKVGIEQIDSGQWVEIVSVSKGLLLVQPK